MKCVRSTKTKVLNFTSRQKKRCLNFKNNNNDHDMDGKTQYHKRCTFLKLNYRFSGSPIKIPKREWHNYPKFPTKNRQKYLRKFCKMKLIMLDVKTL